MVKKFICKPSLSGRVVKASTKKKVVKAATGQDMLDVFETRLAELSVLTKTDVSCTSLNASREVEINDDDSTIKYEDVGGGFGEPNSVYSLAEIKEFWNNENNNDPILKDYSTYEEWWSDTKSNFLEEVNE